MFLIATVRFRGSSVRPGTHSSRTVTLDEHPSAARVDHDLRDARIPEQILDRFQKRQDAIQAAHKRPSRDVIEVTGLHVEVVRFQVAALRRQRIQSVVRHRDRLRVLKLGEDARLKQVVRFQHVRLAGAQTVLRCRGASGEERDVRVSARLRPGCSAPSACPRDRTVPPQCAR